MEVYRGRRFRVEVEDVELPNGKSIRAERVVFPRVVTVLPVVGGHFVFIKQYRPVFKRYTLELPSGVVDPGEEPEEAAGRELEEEAGLRPRGLELLFSGVVSPGYSTEHAFIYAAEAEELGRNNPEPYEVIEVVKIPSSRAYELAVTGGIEDMRATLAVLLYFAKHAKPSSGAGL